jgi:hypothetical protein
MIKKHHSVSYAVNKLRVKLFEIQNPALPWLTSEAISVLARLLRPTDIGLEFGSGRSTQWLAKKCAKLTSIENNEFWFRKVSNDIKVFDNVDYFLQSVDRNDERQSEYLKIFQRISDNSIDFVLDDGKLRDHVALLSLSKLKQGGLFILDNAERYIPNGLNIPESVGPSTNHENWNKFINETGQWRRMWTSNGVTSTLIYIKS